MSKPSAILAMLMCTLNILAQTPNSDGVVKNNIVDENLSNKGYLTLGVRNTISMFNGGNIGYTGLGVGGHFRIPITPRINTEWYGDYISSDLGGLDIMLIII
ncbi:MAG: hypothetical protein M0D57_13700 [Sphingobacteriales bacterium JAD_PAG50586_3]|nr:MAG: hypothetical protein M0D57_13700 [Sphingobacteriales bacterium JAD_PAG50586_3]